MQANGNANQRIARISAHLNPNYPKMEGSSGLQQVSCRAKGGAPGFKVAILGAAGEIGQPLAMLMKMNPLVSVLHLYDVVNSPGVTADISHMDTGAVGLFEGLKAYCKQDGNILLFRPEENALRMRMGAERMCMPSPTIEQFVDAVTATVLANKRWVPPGKGSL